MPVKIGTHSEALGLEQKDVYVEGESGSAFHISQDLSTGLSTLKHTPSFSVHPISSPSPTAIKKGPGFFRQGQAQT